MIKRRGLGEKGLGALLKGSGFELKDEQRADGELKYMPVEYLQRGKYQPRRDMDQDALEELAESIRQQGIMQPIIVRETTKNVFEIIAGERRWRAAQLAGLDKVPVIIRDVPDNAAVAMALIENIQRENLNAMEEATALQRLQEEFQLTQQEVAQAVGKSRSTVTNLLRLIQLTDEVKLMLEHGDLEMGHGRAMLALRPEQQIQAARLVEAKSLSVRQTEALVRRLLDEQKQKPARQVEQNKDVELLEDDIAERLGASVSIQQLGKGKGKLIIKYNSLDELDGILKHIR